VRRRWTGLSAAGVLVAAAALGAAQGPAASAQGPASAAQATTAAPDGAALYQRRCASCHDNPTERTPPRQALQAMTSARILRVMDFGAMMTVAYTLTRAEREAVAGFIGKPGAEPEPAAAAFCANRTVSLPATPKTAWNGWSPSADNARYVTAGQTTLTPATIPRLKLKWAFGFEGDISAFGQPTIIDGQVFIGSAGGMVHALRADSGCLQWTFRTVGPVRSAIVATRVDDKYVVLFGDLTGNFYALEAATGRELWRTRPEAHESTRLTGAPVVHDGVVFVPVASWEESRSLNNDYPCCTFRGSLTALRVRDGRPVWKTYLVDEAKPTGKTSTGTPTFGPSGAGTWGAPTLDLRRGLVYVTTGDNYSMPASGLSDAVVALEIATGRIAWATQTTAGDVYNSACGSATKGPNCPSGAGPDHDYGSSAILTKTADGRELLLAGQKSGVVYAFDPDQRGAIVWQTRVGKGGIVGGVQWGMASDGQHVYAATSDAVFTRTATAITLDPEAGGGLTALRVADGAKVWYSPPVQCARPGNPRCSPAMSAAVTAVPGAIFAGGLDGHLRAYASSDGKLLWEVDTAREYRTVNGVKAQGGAIDGPGPTIMNGMVLVNSGYTRYGGIPGNVLLAFAADSASR
jgi:polyvinyl alcohol dehydrogenase (cytochrome)